MKVKFVFGPLIHANRMKIITLRIFCYFFFVANYKGLKKVYLIYVFISLFFKFYFAIYFIQIHQFFFERGVNLRAKGMVPPIIYYDYIILKQGQLSYRFVIHPLILKKKAFDIFSSLSTSHLYHSFFNQFLLLLLLRVMLISLPFVSLGNDNEYQILSGCLLRDDLPIFFYCFFFVV